MKKLILLFTIVCANQLYGMEPIEPKWSLQKAEHISQLPQDVRLTIINTALAESNTLVEAINALKNASTLYGVRYDLLKNATLMQALMKRFPGKVREEIALAIKQPDVYQELVATLEKHQNIDQAIASINENFTFENLKDFTALVHMLATEFHKTTAQVAKKFNSPIARRYLKLGGELEDVSGAKWERVGHSIINLIKQGADVNLSGRTSPLRIAINNVNPHGVNILLKYGAKPTDNDLLKAHNNAELNPENKDTMMIKQLIEKSMGKRIPFKWEE